MQILGRDAEAELALSELRKGKHILLHGNHGVGKSALLHHIHEVLSASRSRGVLIFLHDHQTKAQFVELSRHLLEAGILNPSSLDLPTKYHDLPPEKIEWNQIRRAVNRINIRDLAGSIIPALAECEDKIIVFVDDLSFLTPTQQAFGMQVMEHVQLAACVADKRKKKGIKKLLWKMKEIEVLPLQPSVSSKIVQEYITERGMMVEEPDQFISHIVKQSGGMPQAMFDMLYESSHERVITKQHIREMKHEAGVRYFDFTPIMLIVGALIVGARYVAIGTGNADLYVVAGMGAALFLTVRFFMFKGMG